MFGQSSIGSTTNSQSPLFGTTVTSSFGGAPPSSDGQRHEFGLATSTSAFSGTTATTAPTVFGATAKTTASNVFGTASTFGSVAMKGSIFGGENPMKSPAPTFGQPGHGILTAGKDFGQSTTSTLFSNSTTTASDPPMFGKTVPTTVSALFGKSAAPHATIPSSTAAGRTGLFGRQENTENPFAKSNIARTTNDDLQAPAGRVAGGVIGRLARGTEESNAQGDNRQLFGKPARGSEQLSRKSTTAAEEQGRALFGRRIGAGRDVGAGDVEEPDIVPGKDTRDDRMAVTATNRTTVTRRRSTGKSPPENKTTRRKSLDTSQKVAIVAKNFPASAANNKPAIRSHFSRYGKVTRLYLNSGKATIHFATHEEADYARRNGREFRRGHPPLAIFWGTHQPSVPLYTEPAPDPQDGAVHDELRSMMQGTRDPRLQARQRKSEAKPRAPRVTKTSEPARRTPSPAPSGVAPLRSLNELIGRECATVDARENILKEADSIVRRKRAETQRADLDTAYMRGTCADMCSELERYRRQRQNRLHAFETAGVVGEADHKLVVQEYSRSSADQEVPLQHELRSPAALIKTQHYLLKHVVPREPKDEDWYTFLWDRQRAIRKEISMQALCDEDAVLLLETHVRFHLFCSEYFCEEDSSVFDKKLNSEAIMKTLTSLRQTYENLYDQKGQTFQTEAEFRGYMILINQSKEDIMRDVSRLRPELRHSTEVVFALKAQSALFAGNYVRYFKMARQAPFLTSCLLHQQFDRARETAIGVMIRAFTSTKMSAIKYPAERLVRLLGYDDKEDALEAATYYGLGITEDHVILRRGAFIQPGPGASIVKRSRLLVGSKLTTPLEEVLYGGPLAAYEPHSPVTSFTMDGRFAGLPHLEALRCLGLEDAGRSQGQGQSATEVKEVTAQASAGMAAAPQQTEEINNEIVKDVTREVCQEVVGELCRNMAAGYLAASKILMASAVPVTDDVITEFVDTESRVIARETLELCQREAAEREARTRAELAAVRAQIAQECAEELERQTVTELVQQVAQEQYREVRREVRMQSVLRATQQLADSMTSEVAISMVAELAEEVFYEDVVRKKQDAEDSARSVRLLRTGRWWRMWKEALARRTCVRRDVLSFPAGPPIKHLTEQMNNIMPRNRGLQGNHVLIDDITKLTLESPPDVIARQRYNARFIVVKTYLDRLHHENAWRPLAVPELVGRILADQKYDVTNSSETSEKRIYWKLALSLPGYGSEVSAYNDHVALVSDWLETKFTRGVTPPSEHVGTKSRLLSHYSVPLELPRPHVMNFCARTLRLADDEDTEEVVNRQVFKGVHGIIFLLTSPLDSPNPQTSWDRVRQRLCAILRVKPSLPAVPLVILVSVIDQAPSEEDVVRELSLRHLAAQQAVSEWRHVTLPDVEMRMCSDQLEEAVRWLAARSPVPRGLCAQPMREFLEDGLSAEFYPRVYLDQRRRQDSGLLHQGPEVLIGLYNSLIDHLASVVSSPALRRLSWPVLEFSQQHALPGADWNGDDALEDLRETVLTLQLPNWVTLETNSPLMEEHWEGACADLRAYLGAVAETGEGATAALFSRVGWLLRRARASFEDVCYSMSRERQCAPCYVNMPWIDVVCACIDYKLSCMNSILQEAPDESMDSADVMVYYMESDKNNYMQPALWTEQSSGQTQKEECTYGDTVCRSVKRKVELLEAEEGQLKTSRLCPVLLQLGAESQAELAAVSDRQGELHDSILEEQASNRRYTQYLQKLSSQTTSANVSFSSPSSRRTSFTQTDTPPRGDDVTADPSTAVVLRQPTLSDRLAELQRQVAALKRDNQLYDITLQRAASSSL